MSWKNARIAAFIMPKATPIAATIDQGFAAQVPLISHLRLWM
ncbi:hypothetical protein [Thalassospira sp. HJ]|nr:hypothetical protein [Thalassospira sp. HJ]